MSPRAHVVPALVVVASLMGCGNGIEGDLGGSNPFFIDWENLRNPVLSDDEIPLKDPCVVYRSGTFYVFASGASYTTRDFKSFEGPFEGFSSPDVTRLGETQFIMVYQVRDLEHPGPGKNIDPFSPENRNRRLYYRTSRDLKEWSMGKDLFPDLPPDRNIDGALARQGGFYYLGFKTGVLVQRFNVARSARPELNGEWIGPKKAYAGDGCLLDKLIPIVGDTITRWAENYQFLKIDGRWRMIATARDPARPLDFGYMESHEPFVYEIEGSGDNLDEWTHWTNKRQLLVPYEGWNTLMHANSAYLCDWRAYDGHFYLFYAGTNQETPDGRGHGRIGMARSRDLVEWRIPGEPDVP